MKRYPEYKDSGIECLGMIPHHWVIGRLKHYNEIIMGQSPDSEDYTDDPNSLPFLQGNAEFGKQFPTPSIYCGTANKITKVNDVLISVRAPVGALNISDRIYGIGRGLAAVREPQKFKLNYFYLQMAKSYFDSLSTGSTFSAISVDDLKNLPYPKISLEEQTAIASFLDHKTQQIDNLVAKKERLIELLKEERTAVINQAVTKGLPAGARAKAGLDPNVPMKDSGIEWLGEIPEHWEVKRMKFIVKDRLKYGANESAEEEVLEHPRYIRITDFDSDGKLRDDTFKSLTPEIANEYLLEKGDVLFARSGATVGKTFIFKNYNGEACFAGYLIKASPRQNILEPDFLYYVTLSSYYQNWKNSIFIQATIQNIGADKYQNLFIPIPPVDEQKLIITNITDNTYKIDMMLEHLNDEIDLFNEYKTSLINEAVTGKIDVRE